MPTVEKYEIDYFQDLKQAGIPEEQATAILKVLESKEKRINEERLTKSDIKELEWKIEGLRKETTAQTEMLRKETFTAIESLRKDTFSAIESLRKDTFSAIESLRKDTFTAIEGLQKETATAVESLRKDTKIEIEQLKSGLTATIIKTVIWTGAGVVISLAGLIKYLH